MGTGTKRIELTPYEAAVGVMDSVCSNMESSLSSISSANEALYQSWNGESADAFLKAMISFEVNFQNRNTDLTLRIAALQQSEEAFLTFDRETADEFNNIHY